MNRDSHFGPFDRFPSEPAPSEVLLFARSIAGEAVGFDRMPGERDATAEFQLLQWLADISPEHELRLQKLLREQAIAIEANEREGRRFDWLGNATEDWDEAKHPRQGGPPNAGWFASTGGSGSIPTSPVSTPPRADRLAAPPRHEQDALAQAPPVGQPPARRGLPGPPPAGNRPRSKFGEWPDRPAGFIPQNVRQNGMPWAGRRKVMAAYDALPTRVKGAMLRDHGVEISLDANDQAVLADLKQRGIPVDKQANGVYDSRAGVIHIFDRSTKAGGQPQLNEQPDHTLRHEIGHAMDHHLRDMSRSPGFLQAYRADLTAVTNPAALKDKEKYYLSDPKEAYAEATARLLDGKDPGTLHNSVRYLQRDNDVRHLMELRPN